MLLLLAPYRISGVAADAVVAADAMRPVWRGAPTPSAPKLLAGVASRLTLQKDARARSGIAEQMGLRVDATLSIPSLPATIGERGTFFVCHSERSEESLSSHSAASKGIPRTYGPRDDNASPRVAMR